MSKLTRTLALMGALAGLSAGAAATAQDTKKKADDKKPAATKPADDTKKAPAKDDTKKAPTKAAAGTFEVYKDKSGKFRFRIKDGEGVQLAMSHIGHATKEDAEKAIKGIQAIAAGAKIVEEKD